MSVVVVVFVGIFVSFLIDVQIVVDMIEVFSIVLLNLFVEIMMFGKSDLYVCKVMVIVNGEVLIGIDIDYCLVLIIFVNGGKVFDEECECLWLQVLCNLIDEML